jgi:protein disulfide-isomerase-like protein
MGGGTSTQCNKIILLLIIVILMYLLLCKNTSGFGGSIARLVGGGGGVKKLTKSNYQDTVGSGKTVFIKVYTDWCGYCKSLLGPWKDLAKELGDDNDVVIAEVDADQEKELASSLGAKGFPTIVLVKNGQKIPYSGGRDVASMKAFVLSKK